MDDPYFNLKFTSILLDYHNNEKTIYLPVKIQALVNG